MSSILHILIKEGALRTNIPKLLVFSGERLKGEASFEQWSYELQSLRKTYSESALQEGIQRSLEGAATDTVHNMGPDASLDTIIKKFSIIYGNVKSYDILMGDFYHTDQGVDETVTSFATWKEGLLSYVRDKFPNQIPLAKEQQLLKDRLFHGCQKGIRDSVKYKHAGSTADYMSFLEECRKAEDEGRGVPGGRGLPPQGRWKRQPQPQRPNSQPNITHPQQEQGNVKTYIGNQCWQCGEMGHLKRSCPMVKGKGMFQGGNA